MRNELAGLLMIARGEAFVLAAVPERDVVLVPARDPAFAGAAGQIGPGFVGRHVGDEMIRRGEGRFAPGGFQQMALKNAWRGSRASPFRRC